MNVHQYIQAELRKLTPDELRNWCEIHGLVENPPRLRVRFATMSQWSPTHQQHVVVGLKNWCLEQNYGDQVLREFVLLDRRLAIWCACQVSRSVLHHIPPSEQEPSRQAIETAERWVRAEADDSEIAAAASKGFEAYERARDSARSATYAALVPCGALMTPPWADIGQAVRHALHCVHGNYDLHVSHSFIEVIACCIPDAINAATCGYVIEQNRKDGRT